MNKNLIVGLLLVFVLCASGGYWIGRSANDDENTRAVLAAKADELVVLRKEHRKLKERYDKLESEFRGADRLAREYQEQLKATSMELAATKAESPTRSELEAGSAGEDLDEFVELDWNRLSGLLVGQLGALAAAVGGDMSGLTSTEQAEVMEIMSEIMKLAKQAREVSDQPFYDPSVLSALLDTICSEPLGLSTDQSHEMASLLDSLIAEHIDPLNLEEALPSERFQVREAVLREFAGSMDSIVSEEQLEQWELGRKLITAMKGDRSEVSLALDLQRNSDQAEKIVNRWEKAFALDGALRNDLRPIATRYLNEAQDLLEQYGQAESVPRELSPDERRSLEDAFARLQVSKEREILPLLAPQQLQTIRQRPPTVLRFHYGAANKNHSYSGSPF